MKKGGFRQVHSLFFYIAGFSVVKVWSEGLGRKKKKKEIGDGAPGQAGDYNTPVHLLRL